MAILSVDLAYKDYADIGAAVLHREADHVRCDLLPIELEGTPHPNRLARLLAGYCEAAHIRVMLLDGPQAWKADDPATEYRACERALCTPAKTGLPGSVRPENYKPFVVFSVAVYDALSALGWQRLPSSSLADTGRTRVLVESFPHAAWRHLGLSPLVAKARAKASDLESGLAALRTFVPLNTSGSLTHDHLQAIVAGLAGLGMENGDASSFEAAGLAPFLSGGYWREGFIVTPTRAIRQTLFNTRLRPTAARAETA